MTMNEYLFRGKRKDNGEWVEGFPYITQKGEYEISWYSKKSNIERMTTVVIPESFGEFTGLFDKNGKKIFEGDIVSHHINWLDERFNAVVKYDRKVATWVCEFFNNDKEPAFLANWVNGNGCVVIGKIHDNPELLKGGDTE